MNVYSVEDELFAPYGKVLEGYDYKELFDVLEQCPCPDNGICYVASVTTMENCAIFREFSERGFGGMPIQIGCVSGRNQLLNCLEYHKSAEFNIAMNDIVLLLGKRDRIRNGKFDTSEVQAFHVPAGTGVELYDTTLHYAPCGYDGRGYRVICVLPKGTNGEKFSVSKRTNEDAMCFGINKWLLAHPESPEAKSGAYQGLTGKNLVYVKP